MKARSEGAGPGSQVPTDATERRVVTGGGTPDPVPDDAPRLDGRRRAPRERLLVVGGPDVHFRIGLMHALSSRYEVAAAGSEPSLADQFERESFPYHCFRLARGVNPADDLRTVSELEALIRDVRPTIVHTFATKPSVWGRIAAHRAGVPVIVGTIAGLGSLYSTSSWGARVMRQMYERLQRHAAACSDLTVFQNEDDLRYFVSAGIVPESRTAVIPGSGIATDYFDPSRVSSEERDRVRGEFGFDRDTIVVAMVSRVMRTKGVMEFAAAASAVRSRAPGVRFLLVGPDDNTSRDCLTPAEREALNAAVTWAGPRSDIRPILAASDVFVLPTYYREGVPRALLEAASMALPLITTWLPGCADVVEQGVSGLLVAPKDARSLENAIHLLVHDGNLRERLGAAARARARERFDLAAVAEMTAELYETVLRAPPSARRDLNGRGAGSHVARLPFVSSQRISASTPGRS